MDGAPAVSKIVESLLADQNERARHTIVNDYPFKSVVYEGRSYSEKEKMQIFLRDGFIDRYNGNCLVNPGILKSISFLFPEEFPYHPHWKMSQCHKAYWDLLPTIDHINPIARGGIDSPENWVTTSMLNNSIKSNWTLQELRWKLHDGGSLNKWDGLTKSFVQLVEKTPELLSDAYIQRWYRISKSACGTEIEQ